MVVVVLSLYVCFLSSAMSCLATLLGTGVVFTHLYSIRLIVVFYILWQVDCVLYEFTIHFDKSMWLFFIFFMKMHRIFIATNYPNWLCSDKVMDSRSKHEKHGNNKMQLPYNCVSYIKTKVLSATKREEKMFVLLLVSQVVSNHMVVVPFWFLWTKDPLCQRHSMALLSKLICTSIASDVIKINQIKYMMSV